VKTSRFRTPRPPRWRGRALPEILHVADAEARRSAEQLAARALAYPRNDDVPLGAPLKRREEHGT